MKINRPNMADLARTFASSGESDSRAVPETSVDLPPSITPGIELCRPVSLLTPPTSSDPKDESTYLSFNRSVAAGGPAISAPQFGLRRGIWRITCQGVLLVAGATATNNNYVVLALTGPDGLFGPGLHLLRASQGTETGRNDFLVHLPNDAFTISFELSDPVTALAVNIFRGSVYACHLL
jgi:hypothetical protein